MVITAVENSMRHRRIQFDNSYEETGVQAESSQVGSKKVTPLSLKKYRVQKKRPPDNQKCQKIKRKRKLKADGSNQISRHLTPNIHLQGSLLHTMEDESKQMQVDSLNVQVSNNQSLKDNLPVIEHAGSSGKGFPYAPEDFPSPGDVWTWRVGKRHTRAGFWQDRSVHPPDRLQSSTGNKKLFTSRASVEQYIRNTFPDANVDAFFASFVWKIPCSNVAKGNEVRVDQHIIQGSEIHHATRTRLDHIKASKVKDVHYHFESKESCKQKEKVHDRNSWRPKATQKLKADANEQIPKHLTPNSYTCIENSMRHRRIQFDNSYEDTGVQAESSQVGSKKVTPLSLKKYRIQKKKQPDNQKSQKIKRKRKLKADGSNQISRHLTPNIHLQDASLKIIKNSGCLKSAPAVRPGDCKANNEMCSIKAKTNSFLSPATCNICCSEANFCRYCCCILCSKTIDWIYDGYNFIKCEALVDEKFICGHVAHIECALRAYLAGKIGGSIDLDAQYYCRCCGNKTDLLFHVEKIIKVSESIDNRDDMGKVLNLGFCILRGSEKKRAEKLRNHIATSIEKLKHGVSSERIWKKRSVISELEQGIMETEHEHNEEQNSFASQSSKKRQRGPTTGKKYRTQEPKYIEWSDNGKPIGNWAKCYNAYVGNTARSKIDINIKNWKDVSQELKNTIWEDVKTEYHISNGMKGIVLRTVCERWKDFKAKLVSGWITKTRKLPKDHKEPYEFYDGITQAQWETFKKNCETEEFKQISEKARKSQTYNEHPHYLGQAGYAGKKAQWIAEGHNFSTMLPSGPILDRSIDWILARSKKGDDGNYTIPNEKTKIVADKVNDWREKAIEGTWVPNRHDDVLNRALEKKEHSGRVRGIGGTVGIKDVFGEIEKRKGPSGVLSANEVHLIRQEVEAKVSHRVRQETLAEVESIMDTMVEQKLTNILNRMGIQMPTDMEVDNTPSVGHRGSCQSVHTSKLQYANKIQETNPYAELEKPTKCRLAVNLDSKIVVVGRGMVHSASRPGDQCHNQQILAGHVKVRIDAVESSHEATSLPVPTKYHSTIGEAIGSFVQWPKSLVLLRDNDTGSTFQSNKCLIESNNENVMNKMTNKYVKRNTIVDEEIIRTLTDECRYFHDLIVQVPSDDNVINAIQVNKDLFTYDEDFEIHITMDDIIQFLSMAWLNASWLQVYIMWLNHMCNDLEMETIGFMCPHKLSLVRKYPNATKTYIWNTWRASQSKSLLLAPYYEGKHCLLLIFRVAENEVYVFDPQAEHKRKLEIKPQVNMAFKTYEAYGDKSRRTTLKWKTVKCPQQSGSTDCVYYVMRYMYEIVKNHHQNIDLHKDFAQDGSYSQQEMDEIRDNLANYIMHNWI